MDLAAQTADLLARIALRDQAAFRALHDLAGGRLLAIALRVTQDRALAEDVVQEVLLTVWKHSTVRVAGQALSLSWLCVVTRHRAIDAVRKLQPTTPLNWHDAEGNEHQHDAIDESASPLAQLLQIEGDELMQRCLRSLDEQPRQAVLLGYFGGLTHIEIANRLQRPLGTVKAWIRRSLNSLKLCMQGQA